MTDISAGNVDVSSGLVVGGDVSANGGVDVIGELVVGGDAGRAQPTFVKSQIPSKIYCSYFVLFKEVRFRSRFFVSTPLKPRPSRFLISPTLPLYVYSPILPLQETGRCRNIGIILPPPPPT